MRKFITIALGLLVLASAGWILFDRLGPVAVTEARVLRGPAISGIYASGTVEPTVMLPIAPKLPGRLERLLVDENETVREGQTLAQLENRELLATVREWEARVRFFEAQFRRTTELFERGTATTEARDRARNDLEASRASLMRAQEALAQMTLTAPADGTVIRRDGEVGQLIQGGQALFWLSCCAPLRITAEVDEEDVPRLKPGHKVLVRADAYPDRVFEGEIAGMTPKGDPVARSFRVRISLPPETPLLIGMTADCNIITEQRDDALLVPSGALAGESVFVIREGRLERRAVTVGIAGPEWTEIRSGLEEGERIVADAALPGLKAERAARVSGVHGGRP
ncbi:MAG: efflux RND transporter periplasmic adaptor subunit [Alphaproteobacteria bacterium]|nr:efflux RND transporter periplasmic adaptor subunit [Alphaproteobacteria bacterium]